MSQELGILTDISKGLEEHDFMDSDINRQAKTDFKYLCTQTGYTALNNVNYITVKAATNTGDKYIGEFLVIGYDVKNKAAEFPQNILDAKKAGTFVGVVMYQGGEVKDVLVFKAAEFLKPGMFSIFKNLKGKGMYAINIGDGQNKNLKQYSFGYVVKNL